MTPEEAAQISAKATAAQLSVSEWIRTASTQGPYEHKPAESREAGPAPGGLVDRLLVDHLPEEAASKVALHRRINVLTNQLGDRLKAEKQAHKEFGLA